MLEIVQLSSSLFIFTHSVYNFQTAKGIINSARTSTIGEYRRGLSRNQQYDRQLSPYVSGLKAKKIIFFFAFPF